MSDPHKDSNDFDPLGEGVGDHSPADGSNPAVGPSANGAGQPSGAADEDRPEIAEGPDHDVPPRGFPEQ